MISSCGACQTTVQPTYPVEALAPALVVAVLEGLLLPALVGDALGGRVTPGGAPRPRGRHALHHHNYARARGGGAVKDRRLSLSMMVQVFVCVSVYVYL